MPWQSPEGYAETLAALLFSIASAIAVVTPLFSKRLLEVVSRNGNYLAALSLIQFVLLAVLFFVREPFFIFGALIFLAVGICYNLQGPVESATFQRHVPSRFRATVGSAQSMILSVVSLFSMVGAGWLLDLIGPKKSLVTFAAFLIPAAIYYALSARVERT